MGYKSYSRLISYTWALVSVSSLFNVHFFCRLGVNSYMNLGILASRTTYNRNVNTIHNNTENIPELFCPQDNFTLAFNNSVPEHYIQARILYTNQNCQTLMSCCWTHKSQQTPPRISKNLHSIGTCVSKH